ncbi:hypothetical protein HPP92_024449 [Vanilla planifolia]|uniref:Uncharacterized protein n=1 Tax=Vanilla planifolia TaxID=51239 RepID=A0A835PQR8_VANPL|nr:hypothetical protein HPP92_024751 [Vanilla planifolia]KAG0456661.1 hypothetical protein HPP92_024449 [Vanilla planifolia]
MTRWKWNAWGKKSRKKMRMNIDVARKSVLPCTGEGPQRGVVVTGRAAVWAGAAEFGRAGRACGRRWLRSPAGLGAGLARRSNPVCFGGADGAAGGGSGGGRRRRRP